MLALLLACGGAAHAADGETSDLRVQLLMPIRSDAPGGETVPVLAILTRPFIEDGIVRMPARTFLHGMVLKARPVGFGVRRERAFVDLAFTHWQSPSGELHPLEAVPVAIDNAREEVSRPGRVQGILAASNPLGVVRGVWYRPGPRLLVRAPAGLTGACGTASSRLALGPWGAAALLGARMLLTRLPDPEIHLPAGAQMTLRVNKLPPSKAWPGAPQPRAIEAELADFLRAQPVQVRRPDGQPMQDIINVAVIGSDRLLDEALSAAGWTPAEPLNRKSFRRAYRAFTERHGYPTAPVSKLLYLGREPDLVFQKSLNSLAKRHHVRFWKVKSTSGEPIWLGAATHDVTVMFDRRKLSLTHRIDPQIDRERQEVMGDLEFVGALEEYSALPRELGPVRGVVTDEGLAVARLRAPDYQMDRVGLAGPRIQGPSVLRREIRRVTLETRHYLMRESVYYLAYRAARALSTRGTPVSTASGAPAQPSF